MFVACLTVEIMDLFESGMYLSRGAAALLGRELNQVVLEALDRSGSEGGLHLAEAMLQWNGGGVGEEDEGEQGGDDGRLARQGK